MRHIVIAINKVILVYQMVRGLLYLLDSTMNIMKMVIVIINSMII